MKRFKRFLTAPCASRMTMVAAVCLGVFVTLVAVVVVYSYSANRYGAAPLGTYASGITLQPQAEYLVFLRDGVYCRYRQFEMLDTGTFELREDNIYALRSTESGECWEVLWRGDTIYRTTPEGIVLPYIQISKTPTFINVTQPAGGTKD